MALPISVAARCGSADWPITDPKTSLHLALESVCAKLDGFDAVVPRTEHGYHPLCAVFAAQCRGPVRARLDAGQLRVRDLLCRQPQQPPGDHGVGEVGDDARGMEPRMVEPALRRRAE